MDLSPPLSVFGSARYLHYFYFLLKYFFKEPYPANSFLSWWFIIFHNIFPEKSKQSPNLVTLSLRRYPQINRFVTYISKRIQISCSHFGNLISRLPPLKRLLLLWMAGKTKRKRKGVEKTKIREITYIIQTYFYNWPTM